MTEHFHDHIGGEAEAAQVTSAEMSDEALQVTSAEISALLQQRSENTLAYALNSVPLS